MNHSCGCTEVSGSERNPSVCNTCSGNSVNMLGSFGLEVVNPHFNWKKVPKGKSRAVRRARTSFTSILEREPSENPDRESKDLVKTEAKSTKEVAVSESEKVGVAILGQRFGDVLESIPIKKRRFLFRSPSPPIYRDESTKDLVSKSDSIVSANKGSNFHSTGMKFGDCADFSGITILAAAACNTETLEVERLDNNYESSSNLTEDSPESLMIIPKDNYANDDGKVSLSKDDRLHWDLNTVMEAWDSPRSEDKKTLEVEKSTIIEGENPVYSVGSRQPASLLVDPTSSGRFSHVGAQSSLEVNGLIEIVHGEKSTAESDVDFCDPSDELTGQIEDSRKAFFDGKEKFDKMDGYPLEKESVEKCTAENGQLDEDHVDQDQDQDSAGESCSKVEKKVDQTAEDESSSQYEDGEFRESFVQSWGIDCCDDGDQEHVDYESEDMGEAENLDSAAPPPDALPDSGSGAVNEPPVEPRISSSVSADSDLVAEKKYVIRKWEDGSGGPRSARVKSSGWDRMPSGETTPDSVFQRRRERPYFHSTRHEERSTRERWAVEPPPRRQSSPGFFRQDAAAASIAKLESSGFVVAPDGTVLEAAAAVPNLQLPAELPRFRPNTGSADRLHHSHHHSFSPTARSRSPPRQWRRSPEFRARDFAPPPRARISHRWAELPFSGSRDRGKLGEPPFSSCGDSRRYQKDRLLHFSGSGNWRYSGGGEEFRRSSGKNNSGDLEGELGRFRYGSRREDDKLAQFKPSFDLRHFDEEKSRRNRYS